MPPLSASRSSPDLSPTSGDEPSVFDLPKCVSNQPRHKAVRRGPNALPLPGVRLGGGEAFGLPM